MSNNNNSSNNNKEETSARRERRDKEFYNGIYSYMQDQLAYLKRKIAKKTCAVQTDLTVCKQDIDVECLEDVIRLLIEDAHQSDAAGYRLGKCLLRSEKLTTILSKISEKAEKLLSSTGSKNKTEAELLNTSNMHEMNMELEVKLKEQQATHETELNNLKESAEIETTLQIDAAVAVAKNDGILNLKKAETAWKATEETIISSANKAASIHAMEKLQLERSLASSKKTVEQLESDKEELLSTLKAKTELIASLKQMSLEHDLIEKERGVEAAARISTAAMELSNLVAQQHQQTAKSEAASAALVKRLKSTFEQRQGDLEAAFIDVHSKLSCLQEEHRTLLKLHAATCSDLTRTLCRPPVVPTTASSDRKFNKKVQNPAPRAVIFPPSRPHLSPAVTYRPYAPQLPRTAHR
eukprot:TRINITY_DN4856_c0_g1_i1.p1 TRINITY_DN4856_c0_g1~~TRINITY_DN4856_c0_g1_i1.p1  ORF type:complete len:410 (+),score=82.13 TRINITY_DN4856_c0_g1_i1:193-1422(+)